MRCQDPWILGLLSLRRRWLLKRLIAHRGFWRQLFRDVKIHGREIGGDAGGDGRGLDHTCSFIRSTLLLRGTWLAYLCHWISRHSAYELRQWDVFGSYENGVCGDCQVTILCVWLGAHHPLIYVRWCYSALNGASLIWGCQNLSQAFSHLKLLCVK